MSSPDRGTLALWRAFPWDAKAGSGSPGSPAHVPATTGRGRFDLPREVSPVLYVAESAEHAVGEMLQPWRGRRIGTAHLRRASRPLALVRVTVDTAGLRIADLCDADVLGSTGVEPDRSASRFRHVTQPLARKVWDAGFAGLRWWSSFWGDWHTYVLFAERTGGHTSFGAPEALTVQHASVRGAAELLGIELEG